MTNQQQENDVCKLNFWFLVADLRHRKNVIMRIWNDVRDRCFDWNDCVKICNMSKQHPIWEVTDTIPENYSTIS